MPRNRGSIPPDESSPDDDEDDDLDEFASALILRPKRPFVSWAGSVKRSPPEGHAPEPEPEPADSVCVLTPELPQPADRDTWLAQNHEEIFGAQLAPWTDDESRWPKDWSLQALQAWFDIEWVPAVDDMRDLVVRPVVTCDPVSLPALFTEFSSLPDGSGFFLDVRSGDMVSFSPAELDALEHREAARAGISDAELAEAQRLYESDTLIELPSPSEQLSLLVMEVFAEAAKVPAVRNRLLNALEAKKPVRRFIETIDASGLRKQWDAHYEAAVLDLLRDTLEYFAVPFVGDARRKGEPH